MDARRISLFAAAPFVALLFVSIATRRDDLDLHDAATSATSSAHYEDETVEADEAKEATVLEDLGPSEPPEPPRIDPALFEPVDPPFSPRWGEEPVRDLSGLRGEVRLNGLWRVSKAGLPLAETLPAHWGWGLVPSFDGWLLAPGAEGDPAAKTVYSRPLQLPAEWAGRRVSLRVAGVSAEARLMIDGEAVGAILPPGGEVDISARARAGEEQQVSLEIAGVIQGEVAVTSVPAGPRMAAVATRPSFERESVMFDIVFAGLRDEMVVTFALEGERPFEKTVTVARDGRVRLSVPWESPTAWAPEGPALNRAILRASGLGVEDAVAVEFAFADRVWRDGRFLLNGRETRLRVARSPLVEETRGSIEIVDGLIEGVRAAGFGALAVGDAEAALAFAERADRKGLLIITAHIDDAAYARHPSLVPYSADAARPLDSASAVEAYLARRLLAEPVAELAAPPETGWRLERQPPLHREFVPGMRGAFFAELPASLCHFLSEEGGWRMTDIGEAIVATNRPFIAGLLRDDVPAELTVGDRPRWRLQIVNDSPEEVEYYFTWRAIQGDTRLAAGAGGRRLSPAGAAETGLTVPLREAGEGRIEVDITTRKGVQRVALDYSVMPAPIVDIPRDDE